MARLSRRLPAPVIDWDEVLSISDQEIAHALSTNDEFNAASTLRAQVVKDHVNKYKRFGADPGRCGRPPILPPEAHEALVQHILAEQAVGRPCTMGDLKQFIMDTWQEDLDSGTIWRSLDRDPRIKARQGHPMEGKRMQVTSE
jgi:hypothetical protein